MSKWLLSACLLLACQREPERATVIPAPTVAVVEAPAPGAIPDAHPPATVVWRVLRHVFVQDDAEVPRDTSITIQLEVPGKIIGPFTLGEPSCTLGAPSDDKRVVSGLSCYYAGGGDYVEVREKKPGEYVVVTYEQDESYADEPSPPKENMRTLGTFQAGAPLDDALVAADGGRYSAYE